MYILILIIIKKQISNSMYILILYLYIGRDRDQNGGMRNNHVIVELVHEMQQFTLATENLRKCLD